MQVGLAGDRLVEEVQTVHFVLNQISHFLRNIDHKTDQIPDQVGLPSGQMNTLTDGGLPPSSKIGPDQTCRLDLKSYFLKAVSVNLNRNKRCEIFYNYFYMPKVV